MPSPHRLELGVCLDDLRLEVKAAMNRARALGFRGIDVSALSGAISPGELSRTGQRHLAKHLTDLGLHLASLRGPVGGASYGDPAGGERRVDLMRGVIRLAADLHVPTVSTAIGGGLVSTTDEGRVREALTMLADDADRCGVTVAVETSGIGPADLARLLAEINCPWLGASADTGAIIMRGDDPHAVGSLLAGRIKHARVRDAVAGSPDAAGYEVSLGEGRLDPARLLAALDEAGAGGEIILTRSTGATPAADLQRAKAAFDRCLAP